MFGITQNLWNKNLIGYRKHICILNKHPGGSETTKWKPNSRGSDDPDALLEQDFMMRGQRELTYYT